MSRGTGSTNLDEVESLDTSQRERPAEIVAAFGQLRSHEAEERFVRGDLINRILVYYSTVPATLHTCHEE